MGNPYHPRIGVALALPNVSCYDGGMAENEEARGPVPPYGPAIWDATKRGDLHEMEHVADAARLAIARGAKEEGVQFGVAAETAKVTFHDVAAHEVHEVRSALSALEAKIAELRSAHAKKDQPPKDQPPPQ